MKKNAPVNLATLYFESARYAVDKSNRIVLPVDWRVKGAPTELFVFLSAKGNYLMVCPGQVFQTFIEEIRNGTADKTQMTRINIELNSRVRRVNLDSFGRLPLPRDLTAKVGIVNEAEVIGCYNKFMVWSPVVYEQFCRTPEQAEAAKYVSEKIESI